MKNLDQIEKRNIFKVPDQYFETLYSAIRDRIEKGHRWQSASPIKIAFASLAIVAITLIAIAQFKANSYQIQDELSTVGTEELMQYIITSDITMVDIASELDIDDDTYEQIIEENYSFDSGDDIDDAVLINLMYYQIETL